MMKTKVGLYIHIPFCIRKCNYCDFCSFSNLDSKTRDEYINMLCKEIDEYKSLRIEVDTIFFGGGTPTLLSVEEFNSIMDHVENAFLIDAEAEITMEVNPGAADRSKIEAFVKRGVNRFSIGLQSIHDNEMKKLGRIHNFEDFQCVYNDIRSSGVSNVNVDLMYGIPHQTLDSFNKTLDAVINLKPEHLSVYGLILEENTPFYKEKDTLEVPAEDAECDMYQLALDKLTKSGYDHYEISNYAKQGYESRHNLKYWHCDEYIGVGVSAHSYFCGKRYGNTDAIRKYISNPSRVEMVESLDTETQKYEFAMLALRLKEGFSLSEYRKRFGSDFLSGREVLINKMVSSGYVNLSDDRISLTDKGFYVSNSILTELL